MPNTTDREEQNGCDRLVEMFTGADMLGVCSCDADGTVTVEPVNSKTMRSWDMSLITSIGEVFECKYPKTFQDEETYNMFVSLVDDYESDKMKEKAPPITGEA